MATNVKTLILEMQSNWGDGSYGGFRSIDCYDSGDSLITNLAANFTSYATTTLASRDADWAFDTSLPKTGGSASNDWLSSSGNQNQQRLSCVFDTALTDLAYIKINNSHNSGANTSRGAKYTKIYTSSDAITSTVFASEIANSIKIFEGEIPEHSASDAADPYTIQNTEVPSPFSPLHMTTNILPTPYVAENSAEIATRKAFEIFNGKGTNYSTLTGATGWWTLDIGTGNSETLDNYTINAGLGGTVGRCPKDWTLEGSNTGAFAGEEDTLDTVTGESAWGNNEVRGFDADVKTTAYRYFRINVSDTISDNSFIQIGWLDLYQIEKVDTPVMDPTAGGYISSQTITLTSANADTIYYTTDGSTPDSGDTAYTVPISVFNGTLKAIGIASGLTDSDIASEAYTILAPVVGSQPIITITT